MQEVNIEDQILAELSRLQENISTVREAQQVAEDNNNVLQSQFSNYKAEFSQEVEKRITKFGSGFLPMEPTNGKIDFLQQELGKLSADQPAKKLDYIHQQLVDLKSGILKEKSESMISLYTRLKGAEYHIAGLEEKVAKFEKKQKRSSILILVLFLCVLTLVVAFLGSAAFYINRTFPKFFNGF